MRSGDSSHRPATIPDDGVAADVPVPLGTATGIGSLPHGDPATAVAWVLDVTPELPAAPSLPRHDPREAMIPQAAWGIAGITVAPDGSLSVEASALDPDAPIAADALAGPAFTTFREFTAAITGRTAPVKVQVTGPVTLTAALVDAGVDAALARRIAGPAVRARAAALVDAVAEVAPAAPLIAFVDEPSLVGGPPERLGHPEELVDLVSGALAALEPRATTGLHCCGPTDWRVVLDAGPRILSAPVGADLELGAGALTAFLDRGGWIAWGAVPTDRPLGDTASRCWRDLSAQWCALVRSGCDPVLIRQQALVTPVCGLALHDRDQIGRVMFHARTLGARIYEQLAGVRLSVGA